jgi:DNA-binding PadR family transcriptional regulator
MRTPVDELIVALAHGLEGWMLGSTTDAVEIATYLQSTGNHLIPGSPEAIEGLLTDLLDAGFVERRTPAPLALADARYQTYGLTEAGWRRAHELDPGDHDVRGATLTEGQNEE